MVVLRLLDDDPEDETHPFQKSFENFHSELREKYTVRDKRITNRRVRFLPTDDHQETVAISIRYKENVFNLHVTAFDLYVKGFRVNNGLWFSLNDPRKQRTPWFPGGRSVGFGESYASLGIDTKDKMAQLYNVDSLKRGLITMVKYSEYISCSLKQKGKIDPFTDVDQLKKCIAQIVVFISEAARSYGVFQYIMKQKAFPKHVMFYIREWDREQDRFSDNREGYMNHLRIAQLRTEKDKEYIKNLVKERKIKEQEDAAVRFKLSKKAPQKEPSSSTASSSSSTASSSSHTPHKPVSKGCASFEIQNHKYRLVLLFGNHKYRLVLLFGGIPIAMPTVLSVTIAIGSHSLSQQGAFTKMITTIEERAGTVITGTLTPNKLSVDENLIEVFAKCVKEHVLFLGFVGLLLLFDPSRHDSAETICRALNLGVNVKMITDNRGSRGNLLCCLQVDQSTVAIKRRLGKFQEVMEPGCHCLPWYLGSHVAGRLSLRLQQLDVRCGTKRKDNVIVNAVAPAPIQYYALSDKANDAIYKLSNTRPQIQACLFDVIRASVPKLDLRETFEQTDQIAKVLEEEPEKAMHAYGYAIVQTLMVDTEPNEHVKRAMNEIGAASESSAVFIPHGPGAVRDVAAQI